MTREPGAPLHLVDKGAGCPTLIFLHGYGSSSRIWQEVMDSLAVTHRCIAPDLRGWGQSIEAEGNYGIKELAADVLALISRLNLRECIIVAHSTSAAIAEVVAHGHPPGLKGLVLVAPLPAAGSSMRDQLRDRIAAGGSSAQFAGAAVEMLAGRTLSEVRRRDLIDDQLAGNEGAKRAWRDYMAELGRLEIPRLAHLPIRCVLGAVDPALSGDWLHDALRTRYPQADAVLLAELGHYIPMEAPEELVEAIRTAAIV